MKMTFSGTPLPPARDAGPPHPRNTKTRPKPRIVLMGSSCRSNPAAVIGTLRRSGGVRDFAIGQAIAPVGESPRGMRKEEVAVQILALLMGIGALVVVLAGCAL